MGQAAREQQITSVGSLSRVGTGAAQLGHISFNIITFVCCEAQARVRQGWASDGPLGKRP